MRSVTDDRAEGWQRRMMATKRGTALLSARLKLQITSDSRVAAVRKIARSLAVPRDSEPSLSVTCSTGGQKPSLARPRPTIGFSTEPSNTCTVSHGNMVGANHCEDLPELKKNRIEPSTGGLSGPFLQCAASTLTITSPETSSIIKPGSPPGTPKLCRDPLSDQRRATPPEGRAGRATSAGVQGTGVRGRRQSGAGP